MQTQSRLGPPWQGHRPRCCPAWSLGAESSGVPASPSISLGVGVPFRLSLSTPGDLGLDTYVHTQQTHTLAETRVHTHRCGALTRSPVPSEFCWVSSIQAGLSALLPPTLPWLMRTRVAICGSWPCRASALRAPGPSCLSAGSWVGSRSSLERQVIPTFPQDGAGSHASPGVHQAPRPATGGPAASLLQHPVGTQLSPAGGHSLGLPDGSCPGCARQGAFAQPTPTYPTLGPEAFTHFTSV